MRFINRKVKAPQTPLSRAERMLGVRCAQVYTAIVLSLLIPATAHAKLSDWFKSVGDEFVVIMPIIVAILGACGVALAGFGVISGIMAKKHQRPLEHQGYFVVGGVLLVLLIPLVISIGESISGQDAQQAVQDLKL